MNNLKRAFKKVFPVFITFLTSLIIFATLSLLQDNKKEMLELTTEIIAFLFLTYLLITIYIVKEEEQTQNKIDDYIEENLKLKNQFLAKEKELEEYFLVWIHQIKTPITAIKLICENPIEYQSYKDIQRELIYIEDYTNMTLNYLKTIQHNADMDISEVEIDKIIKSIIKRYSLLFIQNRISLDYKPSQAKVITDSKWCGVIIEQILSNSIKYTKNGKIKIEYISEQNSLEISDTGIGIRESDLPKIFEKGYSGFNGRLNQKSSGIGLFLVKQISEKLGYEIKVESKIGEGTKFKINFNSLNKKSSY